MAKTRPNTEIDDLVNKTGLYKYKRKVWLKPGPDPVYTGPEFFEAVLDYFSNVNDTGPYSIATICLHLGILRRTWYDYEVKGGEYKAAIDMANEFIMGDRELRVQIKDHFTPGTLALLRHYSGLRDGYGNDGPSINVGAGGTVNVVQKERDVDKALGHLMDAEIGADSSASEAEDSQGEAGANPTRRDSESSGDEWDDAAPE